MEIKIPKEVRAHKETIFFGLSARQFICAVLAVAAPVAVTGFFSYNGLTFEQFAWAWFKSQVLCAGPRTFQSENTYCKALTKKGVRDYD